MSASHNAPAQQNATAAQGGGVHLNPTNSRSGRNMSAPSWRGPRATSADLADSADPFVTAGSQAAAAMAGLSLSATAPTFTPAADAAATPVGVLNVGAEDDGPVIVTSGRSSLPVTSSRTTTMLPIGSKSQPSSPPRSNVHFSTDVDPSKASPGGRFLQVENVQGKDLVEDGIFSKLNGMPGYHENVVQNGRFGVQPISGDQQDLVVFIFSDSLSYTTDLFHLLDAEGRFATRFISHHAYHSAGGKGPASQYCGQLTVSAKYTGLTRKFDTERIGEGVHTLLQRFGTVTAFKDVNNAQIPTTGYRAEFDKVSSANQAASSLHHGSTMARATLDNLVIHASQYEPPTFGSTVVRNHSSGSVSPTAVATPSTGSNDSHEKMFYSPTGRTGQRQDGNGNLIAVPGHRQVERCQRPSDDTDDAVAASSGSHGPSAPQTPERWQAFDIHGTYRMRDARSGQPSALPTRKPQDVIPQRIIEGTDVRTTLMIRNIPGRWRAQDLDRLLRSGTLGLYDFSYLRVDFSQGNAVGYAFVNWISADALLLFVQLHKGRYLGPEAKKPCDVSYANIQGYECLVTKFRNSSIMQEAESFRPMLWHTRETAPTQQQIGDQLEFPGPDNNAKLQRSIENAGSIGLYAPRHRSAGRENRRPYSQYDRGTPAQVHDEQQFYTWAPPQHYHQQHMGAPMNPYMIHPQAGYYHQQPMQPMQPMHHMQPQQQIMYNPGVNVNTASQLRTHTDGELGYHYTTVPAYITPVGAYGQTVAMNTDSHFETAAYYPKSETPRFFQERQHPGGQGSQGAQGGQGQ